MLKKKLLCLLLISLFFQTIVTAQKKPNIIFILADDYGFGEVGVFGADRYKTPNIDALAQNGVRFNHCYTAALCGPSRALILTGRYAFRTGAYNQDNTGNFTPQQETMIAKVLKKAGYATASIGKWGQLPLMPADFAFDEYLTFKGSGIYWNYQAKGKEYTVNGNQVILKNNQYLPDVMHNLAVDFLARNKNNPFFLYYPLSHVHGEILPTPDSKKDSKDIYKDNVAYMDKLVGQLMKSVDSLDLRKNTVIFFMGDNGTAKAYADSATIKGRRIVGQKGTMQEGGGLVPFIATWKGVTPKGKMASDVIDASDIFPTLMDIAGVKETEHPLDGESLLPIIKGKKTTHRTWAYNQLARMWYVRELNWKLNQKGELFDMTKAPFEEILVTKETENDEAKAARARLQKVLDQLNPGATTPDDGNESGRHANKKNKKEKGDKSEGE